MYALKDRFGQVMATYSTKLQARSARSSVFGHVKGAKIVKIANSKSNPSKAERTVARQKATVKRRVAVALAKYLKQQNPGMPLAGATVEKRKGGAVLITPIKMQRELYT